VPDSFRIVQDRDFVSTMPFAILGYEHSGLEVIIDEAGNCLLAPSVVERYFRARRNQVRDRYIDGWLLSRRGRSSPANASGFDTHRDSITSRFDCR
jgi:hypothetical protein